MQPTQPTYLTGRDVVNAVESTLMGNKDNVVPDVIVPNINKVSTQGWLLNQGLSSYPENSQPTWAMNQEYMPIADLSEQDGWMLNSQGMLPVFDDSAEHSWVGPVKPGMGSGRTGNEWKLCPYCSYKTSAGTSAMNRHITVKHEKVKPYECTQCVFRCSVKTNLGNHLRKSHNMSLEENSFRLQNKSQHQKQMMMDINNNLKKPQVSYQNANGKEKIYNKSLYIFNQMIQNKTSSDSKVAGNGASQGPLQGTKKFPVTLNDGILANKSQVHDKQGQGLGNSTSRPSTETQKTEKQRFACHNCDHVSDNSETWKQHFKENHVKPRGIKTKKWEDSKNTNTAVTNIKKIVNVSKITKINEKLPQENCNFPCPNCSFEADNLDSWEMHINEKHSKNKNSIEITVENTITINEKQACPRTGCTYEADNEPITWKRHFNEAHKAVQVANVIDFPPFQDAFVPSITDSMPWYTIVGQNDARDLNTNKDTDNVVEYSEKAGEEDIIDIDSIFKDNKLSETQKENIVEGEEKISELDETIHEVITKQEEIPSERHEKYRKHYGTTDQVKEVKRKLEEILNTLDKKYDTSPNEDSSTNISTSEPADFKQLDSDEDIDGKKKVVQDLPESSQDSDRQDNKNPSCLNQLEKKLKQLTEEISNEKNMVMQLQNQMIKTIKIANKEKHLTNILQKHLNVTTKIANDEKIRSNLLQYKLDNASNRIRYEQTRTEILRSKIIDVEKDIKSCGTECVQNGKELSSIQKPSRQNTHLQPLEEDVYSIIITSESNDIQNICNSKEKVTGKNAVDMNIKLIDDKTFCKKFNYCKSPVLTEKLLKEKIMHIKKFHKKDRKMFECQPCMQEIRTEKSFNIHKIVYHSVPEHHQCQHCPRQFMWKSSLKTHENIIHKGKHPKPEQAAFSNIKCHQTNLNNCLKLEIIKPFQNLTCNMCIFTTPWKDGLEWHHKTAHIQDTH